MNATIVNMNGENHTVPADLLFVQNARVPIFTGIPMTGVEGEEETAAVGTEVGKKEKKGNRIT